MPYGRHQVYVGSRPYHYYGGRFYRSSTFGYELVAAPLGAMIVQLPLGFATVRVGSQPYYVFNNTYFIWNPLRRMFRVVANPHARHGGRR